MPTQHRPQHGQHGPLEGACSASHLLLLPPYAVHTSVWHVQPVDRVRSGACAVPMHLRSEILRVDLGVDDRFSGLPLPRALRC